MAAERKTELRNQAIYSVYLRNHTPEGSFRALLVPDLIAFACVFGLPFFLEWVPGRWGIFLGQLAAVVPLVYTVKVLRLHYGLPWGKGRRSKRDR